MYCKKCTSIVSWGILIITQYWNNADYRLQQKHIASINNLIAPSMPVLKVKNQFPYGENEWDFYFQKWCTQELTTECKPDQSESSSLESSSHLLIEVESTGGGSDADVSVLNSHKVQIHEVSMHLPVARRRVPATHSQDLQALHRLQTEVKSKRTCQNKSKTSGKSNGKNLPYPTFQSLFCGWRGPKGHSLLPGRMCSGGVQSICSSSLPFFLRFPVSANVSSNRSLNTSRQPTRNHSIFLSQTSKVSICEDTKEREGVAVHSIISVWWIQALQQVSDVTDVYASFTHCVGLYGKETKLLKTRYLQMRCILETEGVELYLRPLWEGSLPAGLQWTWAQQSCRARCQSSCKEKHVRWQVSSRSIRTWWISCTISCGDTWEETTDFVTIFGYKC